MFTKMNAFLVFIGIFNCFYIANGINLNGKKSKNFFFITRFSLFNFFILKISQLNHAITSLIQISVG